MHVKALRLPGAFLIEPRRFEDNRGFFSETFNARDFEAALRDVGVEAPTFVQDNHSYTKKEGTIRGLHFQAPPRAQAKLVRVVRGAVRDVIVDIRKGSPSYLEWEAVELSVDNWTQLYLPAGFLHGFVTLVEDVEVIYKTSDFYDKPSDRAVAWNDAEIAVDWGIADGAAVLSERDAAGPALCAN